MICTSLFFVILTINKDTITREFISLCSSFALLNFSYLRYVYTLHSQLYAIDFRQVHIRIFCSISIYISIHKKKLKFETCFSDLFVVDHF